MVADPTVTVHVVSAPLKDPEVFSRLVDARVYASMSEGAQVETFPVRTGLGDASRVLERRVRICAAEVVEDLSREYFFFDHEQVVDDAEIESFTSSDGSLIVLAYGIDHAAVRERVDTEVARLIDSDRSLSDSV